MIKVEYKFLEDKQIDAFAFEASSDKDLAVLDKLFQLIEAKPESRQSFTETNRFVVHTKVVI